MRELKRKAELHFWLVLKLAFWRFQPLPMKTEWDSKKRYIFVEQYGGRRKKNPQIT